MTEKELKKMLKEEGNTWKNDKEFFKMAYNMGFDYDDDNEIFVSMEIINDSPYRNNTYPNTFNKRIR